MTQTHTHTHGHGDSMTGADSVKNIVLTSPEDAGTLLLFLNTKLAKQALFYIFGII